MTRCTVAGHSTTAPSVHTKIIDTYYHLQNISANFKQVSFWKSQGYYFANDNKNRLVLLELFYLPGTYRLSLLFGFIMPLITPFYEELIACTSWYVDLGSMMLMVLTSEEVNVPFSKLTYFHCNDSSRPCEYPFLSYVEISRSCVMDS